MNVSIKSNLDSRLKANTQLTKDLDISVIVKAVSGCQLVLDSTYTLIRIGVLNDLRDRVEQAEALGYKVGSSLYSLKDDTGNLFLVLPIICTATEAVRFIAEYDLDEFLKCNTLESNDCLWVDAEIENEESPKSTLKNGAEITTKATKKHAANYDLSSVHFDEIYISNDGDDQAPLALKIGAEITIETTKALVSKYGISTLHLDEIYISDMGDAQALLGMVKTGVTFLVSMGANNLPHPSLASLSLQSKGDTEQHLSITLIGVAARYANGEWIAYETKPSKNY